MTPSRYNSWESDDDGDPDDDDEDADFRVHPYGPMLPDEVGEPFEDLLSPLYEAHFVMQSREPCHVAMVEEYRQSGLEMGCSTLTAMMEHAMEPHDRPEWLFLCQEGIDTNEFVVGDIHRDITSACACVMTTDGRLLECGLMQLELDGEWRYRLQRPDDPRLAEAVIFFMVRGVPWVNA